MAELEIADEWEQARGTVKNTLQQHQDVLFGNGREGILDFIAGLKGQLRLAIWLIATLIAIASAAVVLEVNRQIHTGMLRGSDGVYAASAPQHAGMPLVLRRSQ